MHPALSVKMAYRHVRADFRRLALSAVAVGLGVSLVVATRLANAAVLQSFLESIDNLTGRVDLCVARADGLPFDEKSTAAELRTIDGVDLAVPVVRSAAFYPSDTAGHGNALTAFGLDLADHRAVALYYRDEKGRGIVGDELRLLNGLDQILLGREFAEEKGLRVDDSIELTTLNGMQKFTIAGLLESQGLARILRGRLVVMDLPAAEHAFIADDKVNQIDILLKKTADPQAVRTDIQKRLPPGFIAVQPTGQKETIRRTISGFHAMLTAFSLLAIVAGFVICYSRLRAVFTTRVWEVGLMRAVGLRRRVVFWELLKESILLGIAGTTIGIVFGHLVGHYLLPGLAATTAIALRLPEASGTLTFQADAVLVGYAVGLLAAVLAAAVPAWQLAWTQPVSALTMRGREYGPSDGAIAWKPLALFVVLITGSIAAQQSFNIPLLGHLTTGLAMVVVCLSAVAVVKGGSGLVRFAWRRVFGASGHLAAQQIRQRPNQSALTVATLGVGVGSALLFATLSGSLERTLTAILSEKFKVDLIVTSAFMSRGYVPAPLRQSVLAELRKVRGVRTAVGMQYRDIQFGERQEDAIIAAYDPRCLAESELCYWNLRDHATLDKAALINGRGILVSTSFARQFAVRKGDPLSLLAPLGIESFTVVGVTRGQPERAVVMNRELYQQIWGDDLISWILVKVDGRDPLDVAGDIESLTGTNNRLQALTTKKMTEYWANQARLGFKFADILDAIILVIVLLGIGDTLATSVVERTRQFGMMRAVGLSRSHLFSSVVLEGLAIGLLGVALALAAGFALSLFWAKVQFPALLGFDLDFHFATSLALIAVLLTLLTCLGGALIPALRAARLSAAEALRNE